MLSLQESYARHQVRFCVLTIFLILAASVPAQNKTKNVVLITLDGVRTQEIFGGLDADVFKSVNKDYEKTDGYKRFWADTANQRREKLMPFFWRTLMRQHGSVAGNRDLKARCRRRINSVSLIPAIQRS